MMRIAAARAGLALLAASLLIGGVGCGSSETSTKPITTQAQAHKQAAKRRAVRRHRTKARARRAAARARARHAHRIAVRLVRAEEAEARQLAAAEERAQAEAAQAASEESECDPNYSGACLNPYSSDYDCEGGSGNGPDYTGTVTVVGEDHYGLDADGDGTGCEAE